MVLPSFDCLSRQAKEAAFDARSYRMYGDVRYRFTNLVEVGLASLAVRSSGGAAPRFTRGSVRSITNELA
ncbi:hypothetical protein GCM10022226_01580 [Sphaerisporangium flaviroseum]|uniref:Uncharacterized protein n=1 Tax=Sphaerisporangium flaviroseum TaxID=509199 RepID=A0ABP7HAV3_9ACTN